MSEALPKIFPGITFDGFSALDGGMDGRANPSVASAANPQGLARNQVSLAVNSTFRDGEWTHRPPYVRRTMQFQSLEDSNTFCSGRMQGYSVHEATEGSLIVSVNGRIYQVLVEEGFAVRDITPAGDPNPTNLDFAWLTQASYFTVIQDGSSKPFIFDGSKLRRAAANEIKPGGPMAFSQGRIWYACKDLYGRFTHFRATDLVGVNTNGTAAYQYQDSVLRETENNFLTSGDFTSRADMGEIRAMIIPRMLDTSLGQGPLQVMCERGSISVNAPTERDKWQIVQYPIATESLFDYGPLGSCFATNANGDILYRSIDGFRSFKLSRADYEQWINTGISQEVDAIIGGDPLEYLFYGSSIVFSNRFLATTWPRPSETGFVHDGIVALDFNPISSLRKRDPVCWEGVWTGIASHRLVKGVFGGVERCFTFARNIDGYTELWEILPDETTIIQDNEETDIVWSIETPSYDFNDPTSFKRLETAAIWRHDIQGTVQFVYQFKPDQYPCYIDWHTETDCATVQQCSIPRCGTPKNLKPQYRPKVRLPQPPDDCDPINQTPFRNFYECSFRIQLTGHCIVKTFRAAASDLFEKFFDGCPIAKSCSELDCCSPDPILYSSAPYHNWGSDAGYPAPIFPTYPTTPTPVAEITNPPPGSGGVTTPSDPSPSPEPTPPSPVPDTVTFPGMPPVILLPGNPDDDVPWVGSALDFGSWTDPSTGHTYEIGTTTSPLSGLQDGTLSGWATQLWTQFSDFVVTQGLSVQKARCVIINEGLNCPKHWFADLLIQSSGYVGSYGLPYVLAIEFVLNP